MSKRKRVSADEKRTRMLGFFHEKREFFTLKELEHILPSETGIVAQSVKDVLQELVDNGHVNSEKIGTSIYFWSFPGEKIPKMQAKVAEDGLTILTLETKIQELQGKIDRIKSSQENIEEKEALIEKVQKLRSKEKEMIKQISAFGDTDPEVIKSIEEKAKDAKTKANAWTDNIYSIQSWCKNKFGIEEATLNKQFNIPEDLDYIT